MYDQKHQIMSLAERQGVIRPQDLANLGLSPRYLRLLAREGKMTQIAHGLYRLPSFDATENHSLVEAVQAQSKSVVCLLSALSFHRIGTAMPHQVWLSVPYGTWISNKEVVPRRIVVMRSPSYEAGIEQHLLEGVQVSVYSVAKTIADCFKFRNKIGLDVALDALREGIRLRRVTREEVRAFAKIDRVDAVMRPYLESLSI